MICENIELSLNEKPDFLIVHVSTDDLTNKYQSNYLTTNLLNNVRKIHIIAKQVSLETRIAFLNIIHQNDKKNIVNIGMDTNGRLKNFYKQKDMPYNGIINNGNLSKYHLGVKKLHLNK